MTVDSEAYRDALRHFPSGVTIATVKTGASSHGLTVSAFCSVSTDPPLVAVVVDHRHQAHELLEREDATFAVSILAADQQALSDRFAFSDPETRFQEGEWKTASTGAPVLAEALAWVDCRIVGRHPAGSHSVYVGSVEASAVPRPGDPPLVYWNRRYRELDQENVE